MECEFVFEYIVCSPDLTHHVYYCLHSIHHHLHTSSYYFNISKTILLTSTLVNISLAAIGNDVNGEATADEFGMSVPQSDDGRVLADGVWLNMMSHSVSGDPALFAGEE